MRLEQCLYCVHHSEYNLRRVEVLQWSRIKMMAGLYCRDVAQSSEESAVTSPYNLNAPADQNYDGYFAGVWQGFQILQYWSLV